MRKDDISTRPLCVRATGSTTGSVRLLTNATATSNCWRGPARRGGGPSGPSPRSAVSPSVWIRTCAGIPADSSGGALRPELPGCGRRRAVERSCAPARSPPRGENRLCRGLLGLGARQSSRGCLGGKLIIQT